MRSLIAVGWVRRLAPLPPVSAMWPGTEAWALGVGDGAVALSVTGGALEGAAATGAGVDGGALPPASTWSKRADETPARSRTPWSEMTSLLPIAVVKITMFRLMKPTWYAAAAPS